MENTELLKKISDVINQEKDTKSNENQNDIVQMAIPRWVIKLVIWALKLLIEFLETKLEPK